jgi:PAS domain S-box-containing protein
VASEKCLSHIAHILVVDDHRENVLALEATLNRADYHVVGALSGEDALRKVLQYDFSVILLDVLMPCMDGFETAQMIRSRDASRNTPIIFVTAVGIDDALIKRGYAVGAVDYLVKPINTDIVLAKVDVFVELHRKTETIKAQEAKLRQVERLRNEAVVRQSEALYLATFNEAAIGIAHLDEDGHWLRVNPQLCRLLGYSERQMLASRWQASTFAEDLPAGQRVFAQLCTGQVSRARQEMRFVRQDGSLVWAELTLSVMHGVGDDQALKFICVVEDMTARHRAADRQQLLCVASAFLLRSLDYKTTLQSVAKLSLPLLGDWCVIDTETGEGLGRELSIGHIASLEATAVEQAYQGIGEIVAHVTATGEKAWCTSVKNPALDIAQLQCATHAVLRSAGLHQLLVLPLKVRNKVVGTLSLGQTLLRDLGSFDDEISTAEELAQRISSAVDNAALYLRAQEAIRTRDAFLSIASHELRTPLTPLKLKLERAVRSNGTLPQARLEATIQSAELQVRRIVQLVDNLFDVSCISTGRLELQSARVDLAEITREVTSRFSEELRRAQCTLTLQVNQPVFGHWDRLRMEQVVTNLLNNSMKYGSGKPIEMAVDQVGNEARLQVRDHGIGIDPLKLARIFECYEQAVSARSYGGLGLGLYIVRQILQAHGGRIAVQSTLGEGTEFVVMLPIGAAAVS